MPKHPSLFTLLAFAPLVTFAQTPPLDIEWVALRPFGHGQSRIAHDAASDSYIWAVYDDVNLPDDELIFPIAADGTDLAPAFPGAFNVASLDALVDLEMRDSVQYALMHHQNLSGDPQLNLWHILGPPNDVTISSTEHDEDGNDLLVNADGIYACGRSQFVAGISEYAGRVLHTDLQGNMIWNVTWNNDSTPTQATFSSVAVMGDSIIVADFPYLAIFNRADGGFIGTFGPVTGDSLLTGNARIVANGHRLYYALGRADTLYYGHWDFYSVGGSVQGVIGQQPFQSEVTVADILVSANGDAWIGFNAEGHGQLMRTDFDSTVLGISTVYEGLTDLDWANGSLSITGWFDQVTPITYVVTGTPQP